MDSPQKYCFCGRKTVKSHVFLFCSTKCARRDSLRSLEDTNSHYRNAAHNAYVKAGVPELQPHRMMSTGHLRPSPSEQCSFTNTPIVPYFLQSSPYGHSRHDESMTGNPMNSEVPGVSFSRNVTERAPLAAASHGRSGREGSQDTASNAYLSHHINHVPLSENVSTRSLRHVRSSIDGKNNKKSPFAALLGFGRSRKENEAENPEKAFGNPLDTRRFGRVL